MNDFLNSIKTNFSNQATGLNNSFLSKYGKNKKAPVVQPSNPAAVTPVVKTSTTTIPTKPTISPAKEQYMSSLSGGLTESQVKDNLNNYLANNPTKTPPSTEKPTSSQSSYIKYLTGMFDEGTVNNARKSLEDSLKRLSSIQSDNERASVDARKGYERTLDTPGMLRSGAQEAAGVFKRRSSDDLADRALAESAAARSAQVAENVYTNALNAGKTVFEAEQEAEKSLRDSSFNLTEGQERFQLDPKTGQYVKVAGTPKPQGEEILTPNEAISLGVPYGTTRSQAFGKTPQKPPTEAQNKASMFAVRTEDANKIINNLEKSIVDKNSALFGAQLLGEGSMLLNPLVSDTIKQQRQAERNFLNSILRRESGAVISPTEFSEGSKQYFPRPGDDAKTLEQKRRNREVAITALKNEAGNAYTSVSGSLTGTGVFAEEW